MPIIADKNKITQFESKFEDVNAQKNVVLGLLKIGLLSPRGAYKYLPGLPKFRVPVHQYFKFLIFLFRKMESMRFINLTVNHN